MEEQHGGFAIDAVEIGGRSGSDTSNEKFRQAILLFYREPTTAYMHRSTLDPVWIGVSPKAKTSALCGGLAE